MEQGVSSKSSALRFVIILGIVSMCADATYEGARSITGAYLGILGASGSVVGLVAGFGELIGYCFRLVIGYLSDSSRQYWKITTLGYFINTAAVPLLAPFQFYCWLTGKHKSKIITSIFLAIEKNW